jgi:hypothetical protein
VFREPQGNYQHFDDIQAGSIHPEAVLVENAAALPGTEDFLIYTGRLGLPRHQLSGWFGNSGVKIREE